MTNYCLQILKSVRDYSDNWKDLDNGYLLELLDDAFKVDKGYLQQRISLFAMTCTRDNAKINKLFVSILGQTRDRQQQEASARDRWNTSKFGPTILKAFRLFLRRRRRLWINKIFRSKEISVPGAKLLVDKFLSR